MPAEERLGQTYLRSEVKRKKHTEVNCWGTSKGRPGNGEVVRGGIGCVNKAIEDVVGEHLLHLRGIQVG